MIWRTAGSCRFYQELAFQDTGRAVDKLTYQSRSGYIPNPPSDTSVDWILVELVACPSNPGNLNTTTIEKYTV